MSVTLFYGDCLAVMRSIRPGSIDLVLADPPYGITNCKWDSVIPLARMWSLLSRVTTDKHSSILFATQPFASTLVLSNATHFKYDLVWEKNRPSNIFQLRCAVGRTHEGIHIFSSAGIAYNSTTLMTYNPQGIKVSSGIAHSRMKEGGVHGKHVTRPYKMHASHYPRSVLRFSNMQGKLHPTQKPLALVEWLVKTYTNEGDTVLDFCMGSGTTGVACVNTGRNFVGIEKDAEYFKIAKRRIDGTPTEFLTLEDD